jgi:hypothetical protein
MRGRRRVAVWPGAVPRASEPPGREAAQNFYAFEVIAPLQPDAWSMAATFNVMAAFDAMEGPVEEIDGRPRSNCPPWFFAPHTSSRG